MKKFLAILVPLLVLAGCSSTPPPPPPTTAKIDAGTQVHAVLLCDLNSGGSPVGLTVPMMLTQEVSDKNGDVLIAKGTPILGTVTASRAEGTLGSMMNQPARLSFRFGTVRAIDGTTVSLSADKNVIQDFELNRDNTGKITTSPDLDAYANDKSNGPSLDALHAMFDQASYDKIEDPATTQQFSNMADTLGLIATAQISKQGQLDRLNDFVKQLRNGTAAALLATGGSQTLIDATLELANVGTEVGNRLGKMLGGRNIHAYIGTAVVGFVAQDATIKLPHQDVLNNTQ